MKISFNNLTARCLCVLLVGSFLFVVNASFEDRSPLSPRKTNWDWVKLERADPKQVVPVLLFLQQQNADVLEREFMKVSDPNSSEYGKYWSLARINNLVATKPEQKNAVFNWIYSSGRGDDLKIEDRGDSLKVWASVSRLETMFQTQMFIFVKDGQKITRQDGQWSIPSSLHGIVEFALGISSFPLPPRKIYVSDLKAPNPIEDAPIDKKVSASDAEKGHVVVQTIEELYNVPSSWNYNSSSSLCLAEFQHALAFWNSDLLAFQKGMDMPQQQVNVYVGPDVTTVPAGETTLDVEYGMAVSLNSTVWLWTETGWMLDFANDFLNAANVPLVVSMSYGYTETEQCSITNCQGNTSQQYVERTNSEFQKIGLRGVSLLAASGDTGAAGNANGDCKNSQSPLNPDYPASSPCVTAVGATMLMKDSTSGSAQRDLAGSNPPVCDRRSCADPSQDYEVACSHPTALITSGGGFSAYSPRPSWQSSVVAKYLQNAPGLPSPSYYNQSNRGYPDVAALGHHYLIHWLDIWTTVDGTSCSCPVFAALVTRINAWLLSQQLPPLGFLNPMLYQMAQQQPSTFTDITQGNNNCTEKTCCPYGYSCTTGWDPVTGLGTPVFDQIFQYVQNFHAERKELLKNIK